METERVGIPLLGEKFPDMTVKTTHGILELPKHFAGKWFVLFSHPGDFTPVCTTEFVSFAKKNNEFRKLGSELIGLSIDQVFSHIKWVEWIKENLKTEIPFPVIADDMGNVSKKLGMIHPGKGTNTVRAVFIVDPNGFLRLMVYYPQEIGRNMDEILRALKALQVSDANKVAMPANWPKNELIGDQVIVPPASDVKTAEMRKNQKEYKCYDWWLCYKKLPENRR
ncbi:MAG: peroxiredoxin [Candidatus Aenigmarchaeota archaeon]|nr:peroxiredoxin [Candidatus Aenigmarchaeota archaeon]